MDSTWLIIIALVYPVLKFLLYTGWCLLGFRLAGADWRFHRKTAFTLAGLRLVLGVLTALATSLHWIAPEELISFFGQIFKLTDIHAWDRAAVARYAANIFLLRSIEWFGIWGLIRLWRNNRVLPNVAEQHPLPIWIALGGAWSITGAVFGVLLDFPFYEIIGARWSC